jgi:hypothetical protein
MSARRSRPLPRAALPALLLAAALLAACAAWLPAPPPAAADIVAFSALRPGADLDGAAAWRPWIISPARTRTRYELVVDAQTQRVVLKAQGSAAASGLEQRLDVDLRQRPRLAWAWRLGLAHPAADLRERARDDSPARVLLFFDGDLAALPAREQMLRETAALLTGQTLPFSTLAYAWDPRLPADTVVPHALTQQLRTIVVASGDAALGGWQAFERDIAADYRRAFGREPGRLVGVGVLTDSDNTRSDALAWYGDIRLLPPLPARAADAR